MTVAATLLRRRSETQQRRGRRKRIDEWAVGSLVGRASHAWTLTGAQDGSTAWLSDQNSVEINSRKLKFRCAESKLRTLMSPNLNRGRW